MALIREKTTLLFSEYSILSPIWLSEAESQLKITANSTYWKADRVKDRLEEGERERKGCFKEKKGGGGNF
jgi:hypothetical protein